MVPLCTRCDGSPCSPYVLLTDVLHGIWLVGFDVIDYVYQQQLGMWSDVVEELEGRRCIATNVGHSCVLLTMLLSTSAGGALLLSSLVCCLLVARRRRRAQQQSGLVVDSKGSEATGSRLNPNSMLGLLFGTSAPTPSGTCPTSHCVTCRATRCHVMSHVTPWHVVSAELEPPVLQLNWS